MAEFVINNLRFTFIIIKVKTCLPCSPHITKLNSKNKLKKANSNNSLFILISLTLSPYLSRSIHGAYSLSVCPNRLLYSYLYRCRRFISALLLLRLDCLDRCYSLDSIYTIVWVVRSFYFFIWANLDWKYGVRFWVRCGICIMHWWWYICSYDHIRG